MYLSRVVSGKGIPITHHRTACSMYTDGWIEFSQTDVGDLQLESV